MDLIWIGLVSLAVLGAVGLLFLWPMSFSAVLSSLDTVKVTYRDEQGRRERSLLPGSGDHRRLLEILENHRYRRTPAGLFGVPAGDCRQKLTLVCGDCAITVTENGTVRIDGQTYAMEAAQSRSLLAAIRETI